MLVDIFIEGRNMAAYSMLLNDQTTGSVVLCCKSLSASTLNTLYLDNIHYFTLKALLAGSQPRFFAFFRRTLKYIRRHLCESSAGM